MNEPAVSLLVALGRTTLLLAVAAVVVRALLGATGCKSPRAHRAAWVLVLLQGWLLLRLTVAVPYYEAPPGAPQRIAESAGERRAHGPLPAASSVPIPSVDVARTDATQTPRSPERDTEEVALLGATGVSPVQGQDARGTLRARRKDRSVAISPVGTAWAASARQSWPALVVSLWLAGMGALIGRALVRYVLFVRRLPPGRPAEDAWVRQWDKLRAEAGIRRPVRLRMTPQFGPVLCRLPSGWELLLPVDLWRRLTPAGRLAVLRHELAHLKRGDAWKSLLVRLLGLPHWFNPAAWWAARKFEEAAEWACDGEAAGADRDRAVEYARTLLHLGTPPAQPLACGPAARGHGLSVRVRRLLSPGTVEDSIMKRLIVITIALGLVVVCLLRFDLVAKEPAASVDAAGASAEGDRMDEKTPEEGPSSLAVEGSKPGQETGSVFSVPSGMTPSALPGVEPEEADDAPMLPFPTRARKVPLKSLRYDGKSFDEWKNEWKTELKPERRAEAINAFAAFGANGYGEEAAEAILEVMRGIKMEVSDANFNRDSFKKGSYVGTELVKKSAMAGFLNVRPDYRIPPDDAVKVLSRELREGNRNGRLFAIFALQNMGQEAKAAAPALAKTFEGDEDASVRACAYLALASLEEATPMSPSALRTLLEDAEPQALGYVLMALVPHPTVGGYASSSIFQWDPASTQTMDGGYGADMFGGGYPGMPSGGMGGYGDMGMGMPPRRRVLRPGTEPIVETLVEAATSKSPSARTQAIQALGRIVPVTQSVIPGLIRAFEKGTADDRRLILDTFQSFIRPSGGAMDGGMDGEMGMSPNPQGTTPFDVKDVTAKLIGTLDPRNPGDLRELAAIGARFTESASQVTPILAKAAEDEDEEVRRTAKQVLEAMTRARKMGGGAGRLRGSGMGMF